MKDSGVVVSSSDPTLTRKDCLVNQAQFLGLAYPPVIVEPRKKNVV